MTHPLSETVLIDNARAAIGKLLTSLDHERTMAYDSPEHIAIQSCLTSASALLDVSQTLIQRPVRQTPHDQAEHWKKLVEQTKTAGRAAYRASLALTDPESRYN